MTAHAADAENTTPENRRTVSIRGFGTLGAVYHDSPGVQFMRDSSQPHGAPAGRLSFEPDSVLGIQIDARPADTIQATLQVTSRLNTENNYDPRISWAYLKYQPSDDVALRLGRLHFDAFLRGDTNMIDYGNLPVRSSLSFYPPSFDGGDVEVALPWQGGFMRLKGFAGMANGKRVAPGYSYDMTGSRAVGGTVEYDKGNWSSRLSVGKITMKRPYQALTPDGDPAAILGFLPNGAQIAPVLSVEGRPYNYAILALTYDSGPLQGTFSYGHFTSPNWPVRNALMANVGYRIGSWTPYVGFFLDRSTREFVPTGLPDGLSPQTDLLNRVSTLAQASLNRNQKDISVGVRYDFARNMALKFQVDNFRYRDPDTIYDADYMSAATDAVTRGYKSLTLYSVALNFLF